MSKDPGAACPKSSPCICGGELGNGEVPVGVPSNPAFKRPQIEGDKEAEGGASPRNQKLNADGTRRRGRNKNNRRKRGDRDKFWREK